MARFCIVSSANMSLCPYAETYMTTLPEYDVIYWDRYGYNEACSGADQMFRFEYLLGDSYGKLSSIRGYVGFRAFLRSVLNSRKYDGVVVLQAQTAFLIADLLEDQYEDRFILDIRDYSYERFSIFRRMEKKLVGKSYSNVISSPGYKIFLPEGNYLISHNIQQVDVRGLIRAPRTNPIVLSYVGKIQYFDQCKKIVDTFGGELDFEVRFVGAGSEQLKSYLGDDVPSNVVFEGRYGPSDLPQIYDRADVILNVYGNHNPLLDFALSNKLYLCAQFRKPIMVSDETMMFELSESMGIGIAFDGNISSSEMRLRLKRFINEFSLSTVDEMCEEFMEDALEDNRQVDLMIKRFACC